MSLLEFTVLNEKESPLLSGNQDTGGPISGLSYAYANMHMSDITVNVKGFLFFLDTLESIVSEIGHI